jgi:predicted CoA-substrate-specific enzyme activase
MRYFCGIDIGSTATKVVLLDEDEWIVASRISLTGGDFYGRALDSLHALLSESRIERRDLSYIVSTGYGRKLFKEADESISEITANAIGSQFRGNGSERVRTIINIGGQDSKVILLDDQGHVKDFVMNDKCAAGTGRFLEMTARILNVGLEELGRLHFEGKGLPVTINSTCTVFAESEIISLLACGRGCEEIVAGVHYSIARRIARLARTIGTEAPVLFDGGPALNRGLASAIEDELMRELLLPAAPQVTTALGAALAAKEACSNG